MEGSFHGRNTVLVKDVEITAPHVCVVMKRPPVPMGVSRNAEKYPPGRGSVLPTVNHRREGTIKGAQRSLWRSSSDPP